MSGQFDWPVLAVLVAPCAAGGLILSAYVWEGIRARGATERAAWLAAVMVFPFALLLLPVVLYHAARVVGVASGELYRAFFPKKAKLPKARVV